METEIINTIITVAGTMIASFAGVMVSGRLTVYRLEQLERKVEKHNNLVERMTCVEESTKSAHKRIDRVEGEL